jgi:DNA invertase Pin-like site-specific DNA recombinase
MRATSSTLDPCQPFPAGNGPAERAQLPHSFRASSKIQPRHRDRMAEVYVRQSNPQQVKDHKESGALQYELSRLATDLGWSPDRVEVIDDDQGHTAEFAEGRLGFQRLLAEVSLDHVGLIVGIEMSRLARSCKDWYQLLETCSLFGTILADQDGIYDPSDYNDRLLLGLKGTMSEAELHLLRQRMEQGRRHKARRGAFFNHVPIGYVFLPSGEVALDPDLQVQAVVRLVFDKFDELGSGQAVLRYLARHDVRLGVRPIAGPNKGQLEWRRPNRGTVLSMLHHPIYAGVYSYGRHPKDPRRKVPGRRSTGRTSPPMEAWDVLLKDHLPAYISWDHYMAIQDRLEQNRARTAAKGAAREGPALLAGLVFCGRCRCRLRTGYSGRASRPRYCCKHGYFQYAQPSCLSLSAAVLDDLVSALVLDLLEPASLELSLSAGEAVERERARQTLHRQQCRQRARYEAERAARQYHAVEPENRLVARELERQWEQALLAQRRMEEDYDRFVAAQPPNLTADEQAAIRSFASDLPALWRAETTTAVDRKVIIRGLIDKVEVTAQEASERIKVTVHWAGGFISNHEIDRQVRRYEDLLSYDRLIARVIELRDQGQPTAAIAQALDHEGFHPVHRGARFTGASVRRLLSRCGLSRGRRSASPAGELRADGEWWLSDLARELAIPQPTLRGWVRRGWIRARQLSGAQGRWLVWADQDELDRLRRLRAFSRNRADQPFPEEMTTPKAKREVEVAV